MNELEQILYSQYLNLSNYLAVAGEHQRALVNINLKGIEESVSKEEKLITTIEETEIQKQKEIVALAKQNSLTLRNYSLSELLESPTLNNNRSKIFELRDSIKEVVKKISLINEQNSALIEHSRNFIKQTVGNLAKMGNKPVLDRKV